jgi:hypothetical protein
MEDARLSSRWRTFGGFGAGSVEYQSRAFPDRLQVSLLRAALLEDSRAVDSWGDWQTRGGSPGTVDRDSYRLLPLMYRNLLARGVGREELTDLQAIHRQAWSINQQLLRRSHSVAHNFIEAGIDVMLLKGAALLATLDVDAGVRPMADVDLLVRPRDAGPALEIATTLGWRVDRPQDLVGGLQRYQRIRHGIGLSDVSGYELDLHWWPLVESSKSVDLWSSARPSTFGDSPVLVPGLADQFVIACIHGTGWYAAPVRWISDAVLLERAAGPEMDWPLVVERVASLDVSQRMFRCLMLLRDEFGVQVPEAVLTNLNQQPIGKLDRVIRNQQWRPDGAVREISYYLDLSRRLGRQPYPGGSPTNFASFIAEMARTKNKYGLLGHAQAKVRGRFVRHDGRDRRAPHA